ncbi:EcsC family protein [Mycoplasma sp. P36-A1]|uniref:EcsC family protein n=1 Tax=Mycoplasma sp. P36-A1 TaxID=3252900 RepID=UPI003C2C8AD7
MNLYEQTLEKQLDSWKKDILKKESMIKKTTNKVQNKTQNLLPDKVQSTITSTIEGMTKLIMNGSGFLTVKENTEGLSLAESEYLVLTQFSKYQKAAMSEGFSFGLGGIILGVADLPALLSIKIKFMFDACKLYGFDPNLIEERLFILYIFQLSYSSKDNKQEIFKIINNWNKTDIKNFDWEKFQLEYRNYLDIAKMLQLVPVIGSVVGATANYKLMNTLKKNLMNCYRLRIMNDNKMI